MSDVNHRISQAKRIALGNGWTIKDWQLKLLQHMEAMQVYGTFEGAQLTSNGKRNFLRFAEPHKYAAAMQHRKAVEAVLGADVVIELLPQPKPAIEVTRRGAGKTDAQKIRLLQEDIAKAELGRRNYKEGGIVQ